LLEAKKEVTELHIYLFLFFINLFKKIKEYKSLFKHMYRWNEYLWNEMWKILFEIFPPIIPKDQKVELIVMVPKEE
jgi:hypothetical protein